MEKVAELRFRDSIGSHCPMVPFSDLTWPSANSVEATELGRGGFGVVLLASLQVLSAACLALIHRLPKGEKVAVKRLLSVADAGELRSLENEIRVLSRHNAHPNLIRLLYVSRDCSIELRLHHQVGSARTTQGRFWFWYAICA